MNKEELNNFRKSLQSQLLRFYGLSLNLHKEQERLEDLIRILDSHLIKES